MSELKKGTRIELLVSKDKFTDLKQGDLGTVERIEHVNLDGGFTQVWVKWDNGSDLMLVPEIGDRFLTRFEQ